MTDGFPNIVEFFHRGRLDVLELFDDGYDVRHRVFNWVYSPADDAPIFS